MKYKDVTVTVTVTDFETMKKMKDDALSDLMAFENSESE
jgi:hypothetical protein